MKEAFTLDSLFTSNLNVVTIDEISGKLLELLETMAQYKPV